MRTGQRALAGGEPISVRRLGEIAQLSAERIADALERRPGLARFDEEGRIVGMPGLSVLRTPHRFEVSGRHLYTWCAWDALFISRVIGTRAGDASGSASGGDEP